MSKVEKGGYVRARCAATATSRPSSIGRIVLDGFVLGRVARGQLPSGAPASISAPTSDKLVMEIHQRRDQRPKRRSATSAKILVEQLMVFAQLEGEISTFADAAGRAHTQFDPILLRPVDELELHRAFGELA